jgi:hypothetical protein
MAIEINGDTGISGVNGSATTPAIQGTDTNTGLSFGTDEISLNTAGTERFRVGSAGQLGIGGATYGTDGHVLTSTGASSAPAWEALPSSGKILQVQYSSNNSSTSTTSSSYQDTNITGTITPTRADSTILIILGVHLSTVSANAYASYLIKRTVGGTDTTIYTSGNVMFAGSTSYVNQYRATHGVTWEDSPATTNAITYTVGIRSSFGTTTVEANRDGSRSTMTLMEVAA